VQSYFTTRWRRNELPDFRIDASVSAGGVKLNMIPKDAATLQRFLASVLSARRVAG